MNRVGRLLVCIAGGVALSVTAHGDITPAPPGMPNVNAFRQNTNQMDRIMRMKKLHQMQNRPTGFSQFARPFLPGGAKVTVAQTHGNTAVANVPSTTTAATPSSSPNSSNPYSSIVTRNVFGLNPIPPYQPPPPQVGPPPPKITLTGITTIFGPPQALFKVAGVVRGNGRPQDESYMFTVGEEQDDVTVTKIDVPKQIVTFMNHNVEQVIPLVDSGVTSSGPAPSSPTFPGQNPRFRRFHGFGSGNPGSQPQPFGQQPQSYNNPFNNQSGNGFGNNSQSGQNNGLYNPSAQAVNAGLSGDDEAALIAAQHAQMQNDPNRAFDPAILPPTPYDKEAGVPPPEPGSAGPGTGEPPPGRAR